MILGGIVRYEDAVKHNPSDQFSASRKLAVELNFAIPEDPGIDVDSYVENVLDKAILLTKQRLGLAPLKAPTPEQRQADVQQAAALEAAVEAAVKKRAPRVKAEVKTESPLENAVTATAMDGSTPTQNSAPASATEVKEITDKALSDAVQARNAVLKEPKKIKDLILSYNPVPGTPFTLGQIDQGQRQDFLDKLKVLA